MLYLNFCRFYLPLKMCSCFRNYFSETFGILYSYIIFLFIYLCLFYFMCFVKKKKKQTAEATEAHLFVSPLPTEWASPTPSTCPPLRKPFAQVARSLSLLPAATDAWGPPSSSSPRQVAPPPPESRSSRDHESPRPLLQELLPYKYPSSSTHSPPFPSPKPLASPVISHRSRAPPPHH